MALRIRMSRGGAKKRPYYRIVITDSRTPRDGRFIERVGSYDPMLPKDAERVVLKTERVKHWLDQGALPSDRVARFLGEADLMPMPKQGSNPKKGTPKAKAQQRMKEQEEARQAAEDARKAAEAEAAEAAAAPAEEAPAEEAPAEEAPAEEAPAADTGAEEEAKTE